MKNIILLSFLFFVSFSLKAQSGFEMKGYLGISGTLIGPLEELDGASSVSIKNLKEVGLLLYKDINDKVGINLGLGYSYGKVDFKPVICPNCSQQLSYVHNPTFEMISVPLYADYSFFNFLYVAGGPILDFQLSSGNNFTDQSGLGYLIGLGGKVQTNRVDFSVFPNYKRHGVIPFREERVYKDVLQEFGVQFGIAYKF